MDRFTMFSDHANGSHMSMIVSNALRPNLFRSNVALAGANANAAAVSRCRGCANNGRRFHPNPLRRDGRVGRHVVVLPLRQCALVVMAVQRGLIVGVRVAEQAGQDRTRRGVQPPRPRRRPLAGQSEQRSCCYRPPLSVAFERFSHPLAYTGRSGDIRARRGAVGI